MPMAGPILTRSISGKAKPTRIKRRQYKLLFSVLFLPFHIILNSRSMRKTNRLLFLFLLPGFMACQKVIELPLKGSEPKYVIEGMITNEQGVCRVHITQSVN